MYIYPKKYDCIVIGGGHAGCEAALICARLKLNTLLITISVDTIGAMSCNPAIGGLAKGHLVKEVDIFGGEMARNIDETGLQFKILNKSKGPAVWSSRAQADMPAYRLRMKHTLEHQDHLEVKQANVDEIVVEDGKIKGVITHIGNEFLCDALIIASGTFLKGKIFIGLNEFHAGRAWEPPADKLSESLAKAGLIIGRLKTGTTPRLDGRTIDFDALEPQMGDDEPLPFSFKTKNFNPPNYPCYLTYTNEKTHEAIRENLDKSPLYSGMIHGIGTRYCPSIEDKVVKFPDRERHQIFLEPQDANSNEIYADGLNTSLDYEVQVKYLRTIKGLEKVEIVRPGYAIEYDFVNPIQLKHTLETKKIRGLFLAGQINGTSGYEEAAAQGMVAGINAAMYLLEKPPFILARDEAYTGVMIDDLVTKGVKEPYRIFTSRAEYRLLLREDNTHLRLAEKSYKYGLIDKVHYEEIEEHIKKVNEAINILKTTYVMPSIDFNQKLESINTKPIKTKVSLSKILARPEINYSLLQTIVADLPLLNKIQIQQTEIEIKYEGYINLQKQQIEKFKKLENITIPEDFDYDKVAGLSAEIRTRLKEVMPKTLGQAMRIPGMTPVAIQIISIFLHKKHVQSKPA
ncbi:tRNA uridine-5-carboxymethylaminomethyl(34) synthesis enzyme MnmG [Desulfurella sp.]|uniref:tRNA uridine-5-carboxymethylaminomethyl(34) synthesis enzyme MnmG n=1 Tax=Desulfurella sp. TaxID=1962857 RepID=UPI0025BF466E|nr:tRNA uridine-5-carboxymethylaminomethyl(34) synthesis enzyme MnmG [Desulfurella sp.]